MIIDPALCEHIAADDAQRMMKRRPAWVAGAISQYDQPLLLGLTKILRPSKVVEIGVASGWSGCLFVEALTSNRKPAEYFGIDFSPYYYLNKTKPTGAAIQEIYPNPSIDTHLLLGQYAIDAVDRIGTGVELAFIDADHRHPWALLDLLTLMPILAPSAWVLLHDLNLSTFERHKHTNRGPKYLYECWPEQKIHSSQKPPMIGAIQMPQTFGESLLVLLHDTVHTPWETHVDMEMLQKISALIAKTYGDGWGQKFGASFAAMNPEAPPIK